MEVSKLKKYPAYDLELSEGIFWIELRECPECKWLAGYVMNISWLYGASYW